MQYDNHSWHLLYLYPLIFIIIIIILFLLPSFFFLPLVRLLALSVLQYLLVPLLQTLTNAQHRRTTVLCILSASIHWAPSGAHITTAEKAVRVRNSCTVCLWIFLTFKKNWIVASAIDPPPPSNVERKWSCSEERIGCGYKGTRDNRIFVVVVFFIFFKIFINIDMGRGKAWLRGLGLKRGCLWSHLP